MTKAGFLAASEKQLVGVEAIAKRHGPRIDAFCSATEFPLLIIVHVARSALQKIALSSLSLVESLVSRTMAVSDDPTRAAIELSLHSWISPVFSLPSIHIKVLLGEVGRNNGAVGKLAAGQRTQCLGCDFWRLKLDVDLPDAGGLPAAADRSGDL